jgi:hypothetical protein
MGDLITFACSIVTAYTTVAGLLLTWYAFNNPSAKPQSVVRYVRRFIASTARSVGKATKMALHRLAEKPEWKELQLCAKTVPPHLAPPQNRNRVPAQAARDCT